MLGRDEVQAPTSGVPRTKLAMRSTGHQGRCPTRQIIKDIFWVKNIKLQGAD